MHIIVQQEDVGLTLPRTIRRQTRPVQGVGTCSVQRGIGKNRAVSECTIIQGIDTGVGHILYQVSPVLDMGGIT
jgi:hypothetical protein